MKRIILVILGVIIGMGIFYYQNGDLKTDRAKPTTTETIYFEPQPISASLENRIKGNSYRENPHISVDDLRYIKIKHYDFDGKIKSGELIVNRKIAKDTAEIFLDLYRNCYPLESVRLIDDFEGDDIRSMEANNTSAFNYRVVAGSKTLSRHALGMAIDINPLLNPYVKGETVSPEAGRKYRNRNPKKAAKKWRKGIIVKNDYVYQLFQAHGFTWGGDWNSLKDYQHFEK